MRKVLHGSWINLYDRRTKEPVLLVQLNQEGLEKYENGERIGPEHIVAMLDTRSIYKAEF